MSIRIDSQNQGNGEAQIKVAVAINEPPRREEKNRNELPKRSN